MKNRSSIVASGCGGCLVLAILFFVLIAGALAKTGLVTVPIFSRAFVSPQPTRIVEVEGTFSSLEQALTRSVASSFTTGTLSLELNESMLTTLLRSAPKKALPVKEVDIDTASAQVAVVDGKVELFLPVRQETRDTAVTIRFVPTVTEDGGLAVAEAELVVGNLAITVKRLTTAVVDQMNVALDRQFGAVQGALVFTGVTVEEGVLKLQGRIQPNSQETL